MTLGSHQRTVGKSQVHITPKWIVEALGPFDLDPCAAWPRPWDCAHLNYTEGMDGLSLEWKGRVWLNPPFDRYQVATWVERLAKHRYGTLLVHARTETAWFDLVWRNALAILFVGQRIIFCKPDGSPQTTADGKVANSGAPVALAAFSAVDVLRLRESGIGGTLVTTWARQPKDLSKAEANGDTNAT